MTDGNRVKNPPLLLHTISGIWQDKQERNASILRSSFVYLSIILRFIRQENRNKKPISGRFLTSFLWHIQQCC
jgi:hypothetical protein